jgi:tetratricopeptide (TPR) repeat protein
VLLFGALRRLARRVTERRAARRADPAGLALGALRDMRRATDLAGKAASAERALHLAIEGATGVKSRGVLLADLPATLCAAGLAAKLADECAAELERCASVRFVPGASGSTTRELEGRVRELVRRLGATPRRAAQPGASPNGAQPTSARAGATAARRIGSTLVLLGLAGTLLFVQSIAIGAPASDELFKRGTNALGEGDFDEAIQQLEAMADQGIAHPDASYNRGLAYIARVRAGAERPGDLGRAAAAFDEALALRDDDADAELALEIVEAEVARRGARRGKDVVSERPSLDRLLVQLGTERSWGIAALAASLLLAVGLALRSMKGRPQYIVSRVLPPLALVAMALLTPLYLGARALRLDTRAGVVVVPELYLADEDGRSLGGDAVPEAAKVEVGERRGRLLHVRWGSREGWAALGSVRLIEGE